MSKKLSEMTLEELWQLFPIILTEHNTVGKIIMQMKRLNLKDYCRQVLK